MPSPTPPVTARLSDAARINLDRFAKLTKRSRSFIINEAVESYLQSRMAYLEDLDAALTSIDNAPTHNADDVFAWMNTWGTENEKPASEIFASTKKS
jgi:predicted transcriptional regulator